MSTRIPRPHPRLFALTAALVVALAACAGPSQRAAAPTPVIPYVNSAQQTAEHWAAKLASPDGTMLDASAIAAQNAMGKLG